MKDLLFYDTRLATSHSIEKDQTNHPGDHNETFYDKGAYKFHYTDHPEGVGGEESTNNLSRYSPLFFPGPRGCPGWQSRLR